MTTTMAYASSASLSRATASTSGSSSSTSSNLNMGRSTTPTPMSATTSTTSNGHANTLPLRTRARPSNPRALSPSPQGIPGPSSARSPSPLPQPQPQRPQPQQPQQQPQAPQPHAPQQQQQEEYVIALHSYTPPEGMTTCISFQAGDIILVHSKDPAGWWDGTIGGSSPGLLGGAASAGAGGVNEVGRVGGERRGWFPSNYVSGDLGGALAGWGEAGGRGGSWAASSGGGKSQPDTPSSSRTSVHSHLPASVQQVSPSLRQAAARGRIPQAFTDAPSLSNKPSGSSTLSAPNSSFPHPQPPQAHAQPHAGTQNGIGTAAGRRAHSPQSSISTAAGSGTGSDFSRGTRSQTSFTSASVASGWSYASSPFANSHSTSISASASAAGTSAPSAGQTPTGSTTTSPLPSPLSPSARAGTLDAVQKSVLLLTRAARAGRKAHYGSAAACVISSVRTVLTAAECLSRSSVQLERWPELRERRKEVLGVLSGLVRRAKALGGVGQESADPSGTGAERSDTGVEGKKDGTEERLGEMDEETEKREVEKMLLLAEEVVVRLRALVETALKCGIDVPGASLSALQPAQPAVPPPAAVQPQPASATANAVGAGAVGLSSPEPDGMPTPTPASAPLVLPRVVETDIEGEKENVRPPVKPRVQAAIAAHRARSLADLRAKRAKDEEGQAPPLVPEMVRKQQEKMQAQDAIAAGAGAGTTRNGRGRGGSESSTSANHSGSSQSGSMGSLSSLASGQTDPSASGAAQLSASITSSAGSGGPITLTPAELTMLLKHTQDASVSLFAALIGHVQTHSSGGHAASHARLVEVAAGAVGKLREAMWVVDAVVNHLAGKGRDKGVERLINARRGLWRLAGEVVDAAAGLTRGSSTPGPDGESTAAEEEKKERLTKRGFEALRAVGDCVVAVKMGLAGLGPNEGVKLEELAPVEAFIRGGVVSALPGGNTGPGSSIGPGGRPGTASGRGKETLDALAIKAARLLSLREEYLEEEDEEEEEEGEAEELSHTPVVDVNQDTLRPKQIAKDVAATAPAEISQPLPSPVEPSQPIPTIQTTLTHSHSQSLSFSARPAGPLRILTAFGLAPSDGPVSPDSGRLSEDALNDLNIPLRSPTAFVDPSRQQLLLPMPSFGASLDEKLDIGDLGYKPQSKLNSGDANDWITKDDDEPADIILNPDETVVGGTLQALVKKLTPHVVTPELSFAASFFMTFRLFTTPVELAECLIKRWDVKLPTPPGGRAMTNIEMQVWHDRMLVPIRLRVLNFVKTWLESHWRAESDSAALAPLQFFVDQVPDGMLKAPSRKISDLITTRRLRPESIHNKYAAATISQANGPRGLDRTKSFERLRSATPLPFGNGAAGYASANPPPAPMVGRSLYASLRTGHFSTINVTDFDPLELARQLSVMENKLYMAIQPQDLLDLGKPGAPPAANIKAITSLSTAITGLVTESVLSEPDTKKRSNLLKYYIKVAERAHDLKNYSLVFSILAALTSSTVLRLSKTWAGLNTKYRTKLEELRKVTDYARNYSEYRSRLRETEPAAVPFLGVYLTDITFCNGGNPSHRPSPVRADLQLINFNKYRKLARIIADMQRFQKAYNLLEINEAQHYLQYALRESRTSGDHKDLYRRSLLIEPRETNAEPASADSVKSRTDIFGWAARSLGQANQASTVAA